MIKSIFFDISGVQITLEDDEFCQILSKKFKKQVKEVELPYLKYMAMNESGKITEKSFYKKMYDSIGIKWNEELIRWTESLRIRLRKEIPGTKKLIKRLKKNYLLGAVSNDAIEPAKRTKKKFKLDKLFNFFFNAYQVGSRKDTRKFFEKLLKKVSLKPYECVFIDDSKKNLVEPQKLGIKVIHFRNAKMLEKSFIKIGIRI